MYLILDQAKKLEKLEKEVSFYFQSTGKSSIHEVIVIFLVNSYNCLCTVEINLSCCCRTVLYRKIQSTPDNSNSR